MKTFIFTFPLNHPLRGHYQPVIAKNVLLARQRMFERYGDAWAFHYTEGQAIYYGILDKKRELNPMFVKDKDLSAC